jgi:hypothetical protein
MRNFYWNENLKYVFELLKQVSIQEEIIIKISDVSSMNDVSPSLEIETETQTYTLFLPNSWRNEEEETATYMLMYSDDLGFCEKE